MESSSGAAPHNSLGRIRALLAYHLEGHVHNQLAVRFGEAAEKLARAMEEFRGFAGAAPLVTVGGDACREGRYFGRRFPVVKQLAERNFERAGNLFESLVDRGV